MYVYVGDVQYYKRTDDLSFVVRRVRIIISYGSLVCVCVCVVYVTHDEMGKRNNNNLPIIISVGRMCEPPTYERCSNVCGFELVRGVTESSFRRYDIFFPF